MASAIWTPLPDGEDVVGRRRFVYGDYTFPTTQSSGATLSPATFGMKTIHGVQVIGQNTTANGYIFQYNSTTGKIRCYQGAGFTPTGTNGTSAVTGTAAAQVFSGTALAAHGHVLHFQTSAAANAVTAAANSLRTAAAAFDVASVANNSGEGGIVQITAGTPAGTNASSALTATAAAQTFTGDAVAAAALAEKTTGVISLGTIRLLVIGI